MRIYGVCQNPSNALSCPEQFHRHCKQTHEKNNVIDKNFFSYKKKLQNIINAYYFNSFFHSIFVNVMMIDIVVLR